MMSCFASSDGRCQGNLAMFLVWCSNIPQVFIFFPPHNYDLKSVIEMISYLIHFWKTWSISYIVGLDITFCVKRNACRTELDVGLLLNDWSWAVIGLDTFSSPSENVKEFIHQKKNNFNMDLIVQREDSTLHEFLFPWKWGIRESYPSLEVKILSIEENCFIFLLFHKENVLHQMIKECAARKIKTIFPSITKSSHRTNTSLELEACNIENKHWLGLLTCKQRLRHVKT